MIRSTRWLTGLALVTVLSTQASAQSPQISLLAVTAGSTSPHRKGEIVHGPSIRSNQRPVLADFDKQIGRLQALLRALQTLIADGKMTFKDAVARKDFEQARKLRDVLVALRSIENGSGISLGANGSIARTEADARPLADLIVTVQNARNQFQNAERAGNPETATKPFMDNVTMQCTDVERRLFGAWLGSGQSVDLELEAVRRAARATGNYANPGSLGGQYATLTHALATRASR